MFMVVSWARAILSISKKAWTFPARPYYYILSLQKLIKSPTTVRQKEERDIPGPWDNLEGKSCLAGSFLVLVAPEGSPMWGRAALQVPFSSHDLVTDWVHPRSSQQETVADFIFLGSKITADSDCSHEIKRHLLLGRKVMTNVDSILKSRDITLPTKVHLVKAMIFSVVMYSCESCTIKKAECQRIDALNCGVGEDSWESLGLQGDPISPS